MTIFTAILDALKWLFGAGKQKKDSIRLDFEKITGGYSGLLDKMKIMQEEISKQASLCEEDRILWRAEKYELWKQLDDLKISAASNIKLLNETAGKIEKLILKELDYEDQIKSLLLLIDEFKGLNTK